MNMCSCTCFDSFPWGASKSQMACRRYEPTINKRKRKSACHQTGWIQKKKEIKNSIAPQSNCFFQLVKSELCVMADTKQVLFFGRTWTQGRARGRGGKNLQLGLLRKYISLNSSGYFMYHQF